MKRQIQKRWLAALLGALAGILIFLWVYGAAPLSVSWDGWIANGYDEIDVQQHYAGWLLFRNSHWTFPLGKADNLAAPDGTIISYTDSIPWVSIALKALRRFLPPVFQWFGWYVLACFALQGAAGALLVQRKAGLPVSVLGGALFVCLPSLWERAFRHTALASQWLILFALYVYLEYRAGGCKKFPWQLALLAFLSVGIHPYYLPPVMMFALLAAVDCARRTHRPLAALGVFGVPAAAALAGGWLCGAIGGGVVDNRGGYGAFSMNLNAPFNPISRGGYTWSRILPSLGQMPGQYDGFNYLGLGLLLLVGGALAYAALHIRTAGGWWRRNGPLFAACVFMSAFAVSNVVYWGNQGFTIPLPEKLLELCSIFRASSRMFYFVAACMVLFGVYTVAGALPKKSAAVLLAVVLAVQLWDLSAAAAEKRAKWEEPQNATVMTNPKTQGLGLTHTNMMAIGDIRWELSRLLAIQAGKEGLSTNLSVAVSGYYVQAYEAAQQAAAQLQSGSCDPDTVYVTTDESIYNTWQEAFAGDTGVELFVVHSCYFLVPTEG